jgi:hypothetical protein
VQGEEYLLETASPKCRYGLRSPDGHELFQDYSVFGLVACNFPVVRFGSIIVLCNKEICRLNVCSAH